MPDESEQPAPRVAEADEQRIRQIYRTDFEKYGATQAALDMRPSSQVVRFGAIHRLFSPPQPESLLDIGCGFGDLLRFLRQKGWTGRYVGIDFMSEFISEALQRHGHDEGASFVTGHILDADLPVKGFDVCTAVGLCNNQRDSGSRLFIDALIARAVSLARQTILVDFLSQTSNRRRDDLFFSDPGEVLATGLRYSRRVVLDHSYMPFEFVLKIRLDDEVVPQLPYFATET